MVRAVPSRFPTLVQATTSPWSMTFLLSRTYTQLYKLYPNDSNIVRGGWLHRFHRLWQREYLYRIWWITLLKCWGFCINLLKYNTPTNFETSKESSKARSSFPMVDSDCATSLKKKPNWRFPKDSRGFWWLCFFSYSGFFPQLEIQSLQSPCVDSVIDQTLDLLDHDGTIGGAVLYLSPGKVEYTCRMERSRFTGNSLPKSRDNLKSWTHICSHMKLPFLFLASSLISTAVVSAIDPASCKSNAVVGNCQQFGPRGMLTSIAYFTHPEH